VHRLVLGAPLWPVESSSSSRLAIRLGLPPLLAKPAKGGWHRLQKVGGTDWGSAVPRVGKQCIALFWEPLFGPLNRRHQAAQQSVWGFPLC